MNTVGKLKDDIRHLKSLNDRDMKPTIGSRGDTIYTNWEETFHEKTGRYTTNLEELIGFIHKYVPPSHQ